MKGIIRIAGLDFRGFSYVYWNLFVVREIVKRVKEEVGSSGITPVNTFFKVGKNRYRVDYLIITCTSLSWDRLKGELERRYVCIDSHFSFNKRRQSWVRTDVTFWTTKELENELIDFPGYIEVSNYQEDPKDENALFEIRFNPTEFNEESECSFYKPYDEFDVKGSGNYEKNVEVGYLMLKAERKWKRDGGEKRWRKRKAWKTMNGNFQEVG